MTPLEVAQKAQKLEAELIDLSDDEIGAFNYKTIMRRYQELVLSLIRLVKELSKSVDSALGPSTIPSESNKEK
jgi:hypothetical protein